MLKKVLDFTINPFSIVITSLSLPNLPPLYYYMTLNEDVKNFYLDTPIIEVIII